MATDQSFVDYICEQSNLGGRLLHKKMFGEYALYLDGKVIAFVCDNHLFVKPTAEGKAVLGTVSEHPPYPGAKMYFRLGDEIDDQHLLQRVFQVTADALPLPKPKVPKPKAAKGKKTKTKAP
ncbi:MAG: TfoX domain-containing protein [Leptothrix sp. (in: Bacteria)]|nr:TfoX domain-containing protein [Leptothrix sp. (in: b-proteobacteria)]